MSFITNLGNAVIGTTKTVAYTAKKHSPEILVGTGIVLGVGATVAACKATTHLEETVDDIHEVFDDVREAHEWIVHTALALLHCPRRSHTVLIPLVQGQTSSGT